MPLGVGGRDLKLALKKATAWNTAVACGVGSGMLFLPSSFKRDADIDVDDSLGTFFSQGGTPGAIKMEGDLPAYLRYDGMDVLLAMFMGIAGAPTQQAATTAYKNVYKFKTDLDGLFVTIAKMMKNYVQEVPTAKIVGLTIKGERGKALQVVAKVIGTNVVTDSTTNTVATYASVTIGEVQNRVNFAQGVFRMNNQSGAALGVGDKIYPTSFELSAQRKASGAYTGQYVTSGANPQDLIDEPVNDGPPEVTLKLTFARHTAPTYMQDLAADVRKKMDIVFTGGLIASTYYRTFQLEFPHLQLKNVDPVDEQGQIKEPLEFVVHAASAAPTGMTLTDPFWITVINQRATDPLA